MKNRLSHLISILLLLLSFAANVNASEIENRDLLTQGNNAYAIANFEEAAELYQSYMDNHGYNSAALYNLANCYAQLGNTGLSLLNYRRAELLTPHDPNISRNIQIIKKEAGLFSESPTFTTQVKNLLTCNQWSWLAIFCFTLLITILALRIFLPVSKKYIPGFLLPMLAIATLVATIGVYHSYKQIYHGIVIADTPLLLSPFENAAVQANITEGEEINIQKQYGNYYMVEESNHKLGWVSSKHVEMIIP